MSEKRPFVLSIAGFDPSSGAGLTADIKTFEQHKVYGLAVNTANTIQTESSFQAIQWIDKKFVFESVRTLFQNYPIQHVKIGIVPGWEYLRELISEIKTNQPDIKIILDPILSSSSKHSFHDPFQEMGNEPPATRERKEKSSAVLPNLSLNSFTEILRDIYLLTPNADEISALSGTIDPFEAADEFSSHCKIYLKGGHLKSERGKDFLFDNHQITEFVPGAEGKLSKHGSGCVLSAAITSQLALGANLNEACQLAKKYTENFLVSNTSQLGYHAV
jgi:hydroxymethylpyrimidine/phosphomethylpyrimidine kinase